MKKIAIVQSNYIPWKGYFDLIASVDEFILYDDMQYTKRDWRNRNQIKTPQGVQWLTVPVLVKGRYHQKIKDTVIDGTDWATLHWRALEQNYRRAAHFLELSKIIKPIYLDNNYQYLSDLNYAFIKLICDFLGVKTKITHSSNYTLSDGKSERLADLCLQAGAAEYVSGPSARGYLDEQIFANQGIKVTWFEYSGYSHYPQMWDQFVHGVTILDLLFNCGPDAPKYMRFV